MKTKLLLLSLIAIFGLASCDSTVSLEEEEPSTVDSQDDGTTSSQDDESTANEITLDEVLSAANSFAEQDYKTMEVKLNASCVVTYEEGDYSGDQISVETEIHLISDVTSSGNNYYYSKLAMTMDYGEGNIETRTQGLEYFLTDDGYIEVTYRDYGSGTTEETVTVEYAKYYINLFLNQWLEYYFLAKEDVVLLTNNLNNAGYCADGSNVIIQGDIDYSDGGIVSVSSEESGEVNQDVFEYNPYYLGVMFEALAMSYVTIEGEMNLDINLNQFGYIEKMNQEIDFPLSVSDNSNTTVSATANAISSTVISYGEEVDTSRKYEV